MAPRATYQPPPDQQRGFFYGWVIVLVCFCIMSLVFGIRFSFGVFFDALVRSDEIGWSRGDTAIAFSLSMLMLALFGPLAGWLLDRFGARAVFVLGLVMLSSGLAITSRLDSLLQFYLFYGVWGGLGVTILSLGTYATTISRWFDRQGRRGLAIGLAFAGTGIGTLILTPLSEQLIAAFDWRTAFLGQALLLAGVGIPLTLLLLRDSPEELGLRPDGQPATPPRGPTTATPPVAAWSFGAALHAPAFWLLLLSGLLSLCTLRLVTVHQVSHMVDIGIDRSTAAAVVGIAGLVTALAFIGFGRLSDRIGREAAFTIGSVVQMGALLLLLLLRADTPLALLYGYALLWGIGEGSRSGLLTAIASDIFPGPALGTIVGTLSAAFGLGAALGSWMGGAIYDWRASYTLALVLVLAATGIATAGVLLARRIHPAPA